MVRRQFAAEFLFSHAFADCDVRAFAQDFESLFGQVVCDEDLPTGHVCLSEFPPPVGGRGFGPLVASDYGRMGEEYGERANRSVFVSVMIECVEAVEFIDEIVALPGLDSVVLGPYDLSGSLGVLGQIHHPDVVAAMERVIAAAQAQNLPVGSGMPIDPEFVVLQASRGVQWLQMGGDIGYMMSAVDDAIASVRQRLRR